MYSRVITIFAPISHDFDNEDIHFQEWGNVIKGDNKADASAM